MPTGLFDRLHAAGRLPTPPGVVVRLLDLTSRDDVSAKDIADTLAQDPVLTAKILRFANSPMAGASRDVTSVQRAVALIGVRGVKVMALSFTVLSADGADSCPGFDRRQFAIQSIGCGVAAKVLAPAVKLGSAQDAFMAGLLSQIGRSMMAIGIPDEYGKILAKARQIPRDLPHLERDNLGDTYPSVGAQLLRSWNIPDMLCSAVERFREVEGDADVPPLAKVLYVGEIAAGIICPDVKGEPPDTRTFVEAAENVLRIEKDRCPELLNEIAQGIEVTRATLDLPAASLRSPEDIQTEVRERIAELSIAMHLENQTMANQHEDLMRRATTDALTGIGNRAAFDARLSLELNRSIRLGTSVALMMMDVDKFKSFNDKYGHLAGDRVLQKVAHQLDSNIRKVDYVARYGGEEFAVIAPDTGPDGVELLAERLRYAVESASVLWEGKELSVTLSIGVAAYTEGVDVELESNRVIKMADAQLYAAKCGGRNQVKIAVNGKARERALAKS